MDYVDYEKVSDSIKYWAVMKQMNDSCISSIYRDLIKNTHENGEK